MIKLARKLLRKLKNQKIIKNSNNDITIDSQILGNVKLDIVGNNNTIKLDNISMNDDTRIYIYIRGDNNTIHISNCYISSHLNIKLGQLHEYFGPITNVTFSIAENTGIESLSYITYNSNTNCRIGRKCMLSYDIEIYNTDAHAILNYPAKELFNHVNDVIISDHCWIGKEVNILKNTYIPKDCIIGANSVVCGKLKKEHAIYAGNPAVLVKENRTWDSNGKKYGYIDNNPQI